MSNDREVRVLVINRLLCGPMFMNIRAEEQQAFSFPPHNRFFRLRLIASHALVAFKTMRADRLIGLVAILYAFEKSVASPTAQPENLDPVISEVRTIGCNNLTRDRLNDKSHSINQKIVGRQTSSCPDQSTASFCRSGYCFLSSTYDGSTWGTCCPAGWSLWLDQEIWNKQKCCPPGTSGTSCDDSEPPLEPNDCGSGGVKSGWACVYSDQTTSDGTKEVMLSSTMMATGLGLSWVWMSII